MIGHPLVDWKRIERVFIGSMHPDAVLGLPGVLCTLSASRERGHESADVPIHVYGPPGYRSVCVLSAGRVQDLPGDAGRGARVCHHPRSRRPSQPSGRGPRTLRLFATQLPPDQLNPEGYYDGELSVMLTRHTRKKAGGGLDLRSSVLPLEYPPPGDPAAAGSVPVSAMTWTIKADHEFQGHGVPARAPHPRVWVPNQGGRACPRGNCTRTLPDRPGVREQKDFAALKLGESWKPRMGSIVHPEQCVGQPKAGRTLAIVPSCEDSSLFAAKAGPCDVLIHSMASPPGSRGRRPRPWAPGN